MERNQIKVLFMPAWYPNPFHKLSGIFVKAHAQLLNEQIQLAVFHVCPHDKLRKAYQFEVVKDDGIQVYRIYYRDFKWRCLKPLSACFFLTAGLVGYRKTLKFFGKADLNHVHVLTRVGCLAGLIHMIYGVPYVISEHWSRYLPIRQTYTGFLRKWITKKVVRYSLGLTAVSEDLKAAMITHGLQKPIFDVISNVVDENRFYPDQGREQVKAFTFLHVSGLNDNVKNIRGILNAVKAVADQGCIFKLIIVGDDDKEGPELRNYAIKAGISNVLFTGKCYGDDLLRQYQHADAFVLFSNFENQPCVLLEALSCGLPLISTKVGGVEELIDPTNGILVEPRNESDLAEAMIFMIRNATNFDAQTIRSRAILKHGKKAVSEQLLSFYNKTWVS